MALFFQLVFHICVHLPLTHIYPSEFSVHYRLLQRMTKSLIKKIKMEKSHITEIMFSKTERKKEKNICIYEEDLY